MKTPHDVSRGAMKIERDHMGRLFLRRTISTANLADAFMEWQMDLMRLGPAALSSAEGLIFSVVAFDGIATRQSLEGLLRGVQHAYCWNGSLCCEWQIKGWLDRRLLSPMTSQVIKSISDRGLVLDVGRAIKSADQALNGLDRLLEAAAAWHAMVLPGPLLAHVAGMQPMAALPRETLARGATGLALAGKEAPEREFSCLPIGDALEGYFSCNGDDRNPVVADQIVIACQSGKSKADIHKKVTSHVQAAVISGPVTSLFAAFTLDLVENGTERKFDLSLTTLGKYPSHVAKHLLPVLRGKHIADVTPEDWTKIYGDIRSNCAESMWREVSAALKAWHEFLIKWLDVPTVKFPQTRSIVLPGQVTYGHMKSLG